MHDLKKMLTVVAMPWSIGLIFSLIALYFLYKNHTQKAKKHLTISIFWILLISWAPLSNSFLKPLENSYQRLENIPSNTPTN
ncbi:MAG: Unknown protein [uncultured Sulfurovum sp.]|uniref:Uncharacterized protein n=1 Tax=uncultured Sulfurovum sp. TaxID=269237 RepID=A0A6S6SCX2_9BACT|nr:MAG: Unknown protein [uncultured Sulfurovum sp.]